MMNASKKSWNIEKADIYFCDITRTDLLGLQQTIASFKE